MEFHLECSTLSEFTLGNTHHSYIDASEYVWVAISLIVWQFLYVYRQLIELKEKENGPNHQSVAKAINNLAVIYCLQVSVHVQ